MNRREAIAALVALPEVARIKVAKPEANDVIVVECATHISHDAADRVREQLRQIWPDRKVVVFGPELRLKLVEG